MRWEDIDFENKSLSVNKTIQRVRTFDKESIRKTEIIVGTPKTAKGRRTIPLLDSVVEILKAHQVVQNEEKEIAKGIYKNEGYVFCTELGKPLDRHNFARLFRNTLEKIGLEKYNLHSMRHAFATRGLENGIDLKIMQELLGHASLALTADIYTHVLPNKKRESIEKLKDIYIFDDDGQEKEKNNGI